MNQKAIGNPARLRKNGRTAAMLGVASGGCGSSPARKENNPTHIHTATRYVHSCLYQERLCEFNNIGYKFNIILRFVKNLEVWVGIGSRPVSIF